MHPKFLTRSASYLAIVLLGGVSLSGCGATTTAGTSNDSPKTIVEQALTLEFIAPKNPKLVPFQKQLEASDLKDLVDKVSTQLALPETIDVIAKECGEVNAFYNSQKKTITICYEWMAYNAKAFTADYNTPEDVKNAVVDTTIFTFFHELGHGLIDLLELPVLGREEDVVDEFAALTLLRLEDRGKTALANASDAFIFQTALNDNRADPSDDAVGDEFADEHSLDLQRSYGLSCLAYGGDPVFFEDIKKNKTLPDRRLKSCQKEYKQKSRSLDKLLAAHVRPGKS
jgi:Putative metallopeptidase